jgi:hypothetical protein
MVTTHHDMTDNIEKLASRYYYHFSVLRAEGPKQKTTSYAGGSRRLIEGKLLRKQRDQYKEINPNPLAPFPSHRLG